MSDDGVQALLGIFPSFSNEEEFPGQILQIKRAVHIASMSAVGCLHIEPRAQAQFEQESRAFQIEALCDGIGRVQLAEQSPRVATPAPAAAAAAPQFSTPLPAERRARPLGKVPVAPAVQRARPRVGVQREPGVRLRPGAPPPPPPRDSATPDPEVQELTTKERKGSDKKGKENSAPKPRSVSPAEGFTIYEDEAGAKEARPKKARLKSRGKSRSAETPLAETNPAPLAAPRHSAPPTTVPAAPSRAKAPSVLSPIAELRTPSAQVTWGATPSSDSPRHTPVSVCSKKGALLRELDSDSDDDIRSLQSCSPASQSSTGARSTRKKSGQSRNAECRDGSRAKSGIPGPAELRSPKPVLHEVQNSPQLQKPEPRVTAALYRGYVTPRAGSKSAAKNSLLRSAPPAVRVKRREASATAAEDPAANLFAELVNDSMYDFVPSSPEWTPHKKRGKAPASLRKRTAAKSKSIVKKRSGKNRAEIEGGEEIEIVREEPEERSVPAIHEVETPDPAAQCKEPEDVYEFGSEGGDCDPEENSGPAEHKAAGREKRGKAASQDTTSMDETGAKGKNTKRRSTRGRQGRSRAKKREDKCEAGGETLEEVKAVVDEAGEQTREEGDVKEQDGDGGRGSSKASKAAAHEEKVEEEDTKETTKSMRSRGGKSAGGKSAGNSGKRGAARKGTRDTVTSHTDDADVDNTENKSKPEEGHEESSRGGRRGKSAGRGGTARGRRGGGRTTRASTADIELTRARHR